MKQITINENEELVRELVSDFKFIYFKTTTNKEFLCFIGKNQF